MERPTRAEIAILLLAAVLTAPAWAPAGAELLGASIDPAARADLPDQTGRLAVGVRSLGIALLIGVLASALALPAARVLRSGRAWLGALLVAPAWMPAWLIYAGLNTARAPDTIVGRALMDWALPDHRWAILLTGRVLAIGSLVLWAVPIAALVIACASDPSADPARDASRLERMGIGRRLMLALRLDLPALRVSTGVVALLMLGSAVPLHLAQVETDAIILWRALSERSPDRWGGVWLAAWPEVVLACLGAWWATRRIAPGDRPGQAQISGGSAKTGKPTLLLAFIVWAFAAVLPVVLMLWSLDRMGSVLRFLDQSSTALIATGMIAAVSGLISASIAIVVAAGEASDRGWTRRATRVLAVLTVAGALVPGVLIGAAVAGWDWRSEFGSWWGAVFAATARVSFLGALGGLVLARAEPADERAQRQIDHAGDSIGWIQANAARLIWLGLGVWTGSGLLGLHEIEASVMVRPPGMDNLPQRMLADLHYARLEELSAGGVVIGVLAIAVGLVSGLLIRFGKSNRAGSGV